MGVAGEGRLAAFSESSAVVAGEGEDVFGDRAVGGEDALGAGRARAGLAGAARARGAVELEEVREIEGQQARGADEGAGDGGAGLGRGAGEDGLGAGIGQEEGEVGGLAADVMIRDVAEPAAAAGEMGGGGALARREGGVARRVGARGAPGALGEAVEDGEDAGAGALEAQGCQREEEGEEAGADGDAGDEGGEDGVQALGDCPHRVRGVVVRGRHRRLPCPCHGEVYTPVVGPMQEVSLKKCYVGVAAGLG